MRMTLVAIAVAILPVCAGNAAADPAEGPAPVSFADVDANADMYIDKQEFERFNEKTREQMRKKMREMLQGGPGRGGRAFGERAARLYADADADSDGLLNESEFAALQESVRLMREEMRQRFAGMGQPD